MSLRTEGVIGKDIVPLSSPYSCANLGRNRKRSTDVDFEKRFDHFTHMLSTWKKDVLHTVVQSLVQRCPLTQIEFLYSSLEAVNHRDFLMSSFPPPGCAGNVVRPLSTAISRSTRSYLSKTRKKMMSRIHRTESIILQSEEEARYCLCSSPGSNLPTSRWATPTSLQRIQSHATPLAELTHPQVNLYTTKSETVLRPSQHPRQHTAPPTTSRTISSLRRSGGSQLQISPKRPTSSPPTTRRHTHHSIAATPTSSSRPVSCLSLQRRHSSTSLLTSTPSPHTSQRTPIFPTGPVTLAATTHQIRSAGNANLSSAVWNLPNEVREFLCWFTTLEQDWQQQEILEAVVFELDHNDQFLLTATVMVRRYKDFISLLPERLVRKTLLHLLPKHLVWSGQVSRKWRARCRDECVWERKCKWGHLALPLSASSPSWRDLYFRELKLRKNWRSGSYRSEIISAHDRGVTCVRMREGDIHTLASSSIDHKIKIWNLKNGRLLKMLTGHQRSVWALCFYGKHYLISGSHDNTIKIWNLKSGQCERTLLGHQGPIWSVSQKMDLLISASQDYSAIVWNVRHCRFKHQLLGHKGRVFAADLNEDASIAFTASGDKTVCVWSSDSGQRLRTIRVSKTDPVISLRWKQDVLVCCHGRYVSCYDTSNGDKVAEIMAHEKTIKDVCLLIGDGKSSKAMVISGGDDGAVKIWKTSRAHSLTSVVCDEDSVKKVNSVDSNGVLLAAGLTDGSIVVLNYL